MKDMRVWGSGYVFLVVVLAGKMVLAEPCLGSGSESGSPVGVCPVGSLGDWVLGFPDSGCDGEDGSEILEAVEVIEHIVLVLQGGELALQKALHMVYSRTHRYVAILFYASWCPFSQGFKPSFSALAFSFPSVPHFTIEESAVRSSILSKYGVHGFPTLFLLNSTMRVRFGGSRSFNSVSSFYSGVTGVTPDQLHSNPPNSAQHPSCRDKAEDAEEENCPFSWARSPENLLCQETYLALASAFVLLRLMYLVFPYLLELARFVRRLRMQNPIIQSLRDHLLAYLNRGVHSLTCISRPCKRSNLHEGALTARTWASKSLASAVAIGDASTNRGRTIGENH
ncbi:5'-adenylylsulfate reductase-like 4-like protein [Drosera capensis]